MLHCAVHALYDLHAVAAGLLGDAVLFQVHPSLTRAAAAAGWAGATAECIDHAVRELCVCECCDWLALRSEQLFSGLPVAELQWCQHAVD